MYIVPPWVPTFESCIAQANKPHTFSFATIAKNGFPRVRTCVFRGWLFDDKSTGVLLFATDARSQKYIELTSSNDAFEACFYFPRKVAKPEDSYLRSSSPDSLDTSSDASTSSSSEGSKGPKKRTAGVQIRLSGFAQCISPSRKSYPTLIQSNHVPKEKSIVRKESTDSLSSSSSSSSTDSSCSSSTDIPTYPIHSPKYVSLYRDKVSQIEPEDHKPTHSHSGLYEGTGNIIPISKENGKAKSSSDSEKPPSDSTDTDSNSQSASSASQSNKDASNPDRNTECPLSYPPPPPTQEEWDAEYHRIWSSLSPATKSSFRRPTPGATLDDENRRKLDKLLRGVDGSSDEKGLSNFVVVAMFINDADVLIDGTGAAHRRSKAHRVMDDDWVEDEVCP